MGTLFKQDNNFRIPDEKSKNDEKEKEDEEDKYEPKLLGYQFGGSPPYLLDFEGTVGERHEENKEIVEHESFESYKSLLNIMVNINDENNRKIIESMKYIISNLNGLDVFWDGKCINLSDDASDSIHDVQE